MSSLVDPLRRSWQSFNERERRLLLLLGATFVAMIVVGVFYFSQSAVSDLQDEDEKIAAVLERIGRQRAHLRERASERAATERRYATHAPALGSFIESQAHEQNLALREVTDQPEEVQGHYTKRAVRVQLPGVNLAPAIRLLAAIDNSIYPVAIERVVIEHFQPGDQYNVTIGVLAYDRAGAAAAGPTKIRAMPAGVAGPPPPP